MIFFFILLFVCQSELTEFFSQNSPSLPQNSVRLSEFSSPKQYSRNSIPPVSYIPGKLVDEYCRGINYRSVQNDYRQTFSLRAIYRYRSARPEELISITETDLWECQQNISHYRYRFSLELQLLSITDTDFGLEMHLLCNHFGYNGM